MQESFVLCVLYESHILIFVAILFLLKRLPRRVACHTPHTPSLYSLHDRSGVPPQHISLKPTISRRAITSCPFPRFNWLCRSCSTFPTEFTLSVPTIAPLPRLQLVLLLLLRLLPIAHPTTRPCRCQLWTCSQSPPCLLRSGQMQVSNHRRVTRVGVSCVASNSSCREPGAQPPWRRRPCSDNDCDADIDGRCCSECM